MKKLPNFRSCRIYDSLNQLLLVEVVVNPGILFICIIILNHYKQYIQTDMGIISPFHDSHKLSRLQDGNVYELHQIL